MWGNRVSVCTLQRGGEDGGHQGRAKRKDDHADKGRLVEEKAHHRYAIDCATPRSERK